MTEHAKQEPKQAQYEAERAAWLKMIRSLYAADPQTGSYMK